MSPNITTAAIDDVTWLKCVLIKALGRFFVNLRDAVSDDAAFQNVFWHDYRQTLVYVVRLVKLRTERPRFDNAAARVAHLT